MGLLKWLRDGSDRINDYFAYATYVFLAIDDPIVRLAALAAAKTMRGAQRDSNVNWLRTVAAKMHSDGETERAYRANQLADEIASREWSIGDSVTAKRAVSKLDPELGRSLCQDPEIFFRRYPELEAIRSEAK